MRLTWRIALYVGSLVTLVVVYTTAYRWGMATYEGEVRSWVGALEIVVQSMTTTGYGQDAPWETGQMTALMILIQLTGIAYIFVAVPLFVVPWIERLVRPTAPDKATPVADHVVILGVSELSKSVIGVFEDRSMPYIVIDPDEDRSRQLFDDGVAVIHGDPAMDEALEAASAGRAASVLVDATEGDRIRSILAVDELNPDAPIYALIEDPERARYMRYAGVDEVLSPRHSLGKALADQISGILEIDELPPGIEIAEFPIDPAGSIAGSPLEACRSVENTGVTAIGAWVAGEFVTDWTAAVTVDESTVILLAGTPGQLEAAAEALESEPQHLGPVGPVLVIGEGVTAATVAGGLQRSDIETRVLHRVLAEDEPIDPGDSDEETIGEPTHEEALAEAGVESATTVVIALEDDDETILTALVAHEMNPDARLFATLRRTDSTARLRAAGVDTVLALPTVAARQIRRTLLGGEFATMDDPIHLEALPATGREDVDRTALREATGASVVGVRRDGTVHTAARTLPIEPGESLVVAGRAEEISAVASHLELEAP